MKEFLDKHNILTKLLALFLACFLWVVVMNEKDPAKTIVYRDIPVELIGTQELYNAANLMVISGQEQKVTISVEGTTNDVKYLKKTDIHIQIDVSGQTTTGTQAYSYTITLPKQLTSLKVREEKPETISLTFDTHAEKTVPVTVALSAPPASNYQYETPIANVENIEIRGPQSVLNTITQASVRVPSEDLKKDISQAYEYMLLDADGNAVVSNLVEKTQQTITVYVGVNKVVTLPLEVDVIDGLEITEDMTSISISPASLTVYGKTDIVDLYKSIEIATIDLSKDTKSTKKTVSIALPDGVYLGTGQSRYATISLEVDGVASRDFSITKIQLADTNIQADKPTVELITSAIQVTLHGQESVLSTLTEKDIVAVAIFDSNSFTDGQNEIPVTVSVPNYETKGISIAEHTQTILVNLVASENTPDLVTPEGDAP